MTFKAKCGVDLSAPPFFVNGFHSRDHKLVIKIPAITFHISGKKRKKNKGQKDALFNQVTSPSKKFS